MLDGNKCCGCNNCVILCPTKAITLIVDEYGFEKPIIDSNKCINCGKCVKNCPSTNCKELHLPEKVYAVWSKEEEIRKNSASGGISIELGRSVLNKGGVVYGTTYDSKEFVHVKRIDSLENLLEIQGSRYVKSNMGDTITKIKSDLEERTVLFLGTPCQCSAVKNALGENENLILVDLICHGTSPQAYLKEEIKRQGVNVELNDIQFRKNGRYELQFFNDNKTIFSERWGINYYLNAFLNGLTLQENCYSCKYATKQRIGNITIGDFWGLDREWNSKYGPRTGISLVLVNDLKGKQIFDDCSNRIEFYERTLDEAVSGNSQLREPSSKHKSREKFLQDYAKHGYLFAMKKNMFWNIMKKKVKYLIDKKAW